jgi:hypothetical protein
MATNFPTSQDSFTNPTSTNTLDSPNHADQHANVNDAVEALQAKVGVDSSAVTTSHDYKIAQLEGSSPTITLAGDASGSVTLTNLGSGTLTVTVNDDSHTHSYAATNHNHTYNVNDAWLRDNGDNAHVKLFGNTRQMAFRTDGTSEYASGVGGFAFLWMYGGDAASNRRMGLNASGQLWTSNYGYLHDKFAALSHSHSYASTSHTHSQSYGGGIYMIDTTWVRTYNNKRFYSGGGQIRSDAGNGFNAPNLTTTYSYNTLRWNSSNGDFMPYASLTEMKADITDIGALLGYLNERSLIYDLRRGTP